MLYTLPIDSNYIKEVKESDVIDMSALNFPIDVENPQRVALLFLRNTGIKANFKFDGCTYAEKERYLLLFMTGKRFNVKIPALASTWARIMLDDSGYENLESILTHDEIVAFRNKNNDLIKEFRRFLTSIPLCAIDVYLDVNKETNIDLSDFEVSMYDGFNHFAIVQILDYNEIILLSQSIEGIEPVFYRKYFDSNSCDVCPGFVGDLVNRFPHFQLIKIVMNNDPQLTSIFIDGLNDLLNKHTEIDPH